MACLEEEGFDYDQFAYMEGRSATQAVLTLLENVKRAKKLKKKVGVVFFDFTDAFGNVDRVRLLETIKTSFGIDGKLFNHIADFLKNRKARIKVNDLVGEWLDSTTGTSAGTVLGPILFIIAAEDIPKEINPKFADDTAALAIGDTIEEVRTKLQRLIDEMSEWCRKSGMIMNGTKIKVINFSDKEEPIELKVEDKVVEQVKSMVYLGIVLDEKLKFDLQVENAIGKAKSALNKVCTLIRGQRGISVDTGIELYKSLIRPHLEYAIPAWAMLSEKLIKDLEKVQSQSLRRVMGAFEKTSGMALEVISNVIPFRLRIQELCKREWVKIHSLRENHPLKHLIMSDEKFYDGRNGTPLGYLEHQSKEIRKTLEEENLTVAVTSVLTVEAMLGQETLEEEKIFKSSIGNSKNRTKLQVESAKREFKDFIEAVPENTYLAFSDGSVLGESCFGEGGCGIVLTKKGDPEVDIRDSRKVGRKVDNVKCEVEGVVVALEMLAERCNLDVGSGLTYVLTDCQAAVDTFVNQKDHHKKICTFKRMWTAVRTLRNLGVKTKIVWIPGHASLDYNEIADKLAKEGSKKIQMTEQVEAVSESVLSKMIKDQARSIWSRMYERCEAADWTKQVMGSSVGRKLIFPKSRSCGMSYIRSLVNNAAVKDNLNRLGFSEVRDCECDEGRETVSHILLECKTEAEARNKYLKKVEELWMESKCSGNLNVDMELILCPFEKKNVTEDVASKMVTESFKFLSRLTKKL